jgi:uncharacterized membrane protein YdjX (TVP38/TMEM64 family)
VDAAELALIAAIVFAINLLPAFGPPTWAVLVFFKFQYHPEPALLVACGAAAAASGRLVLASVSRRLRARLSARRRENLEFAREMIAGNRARALAGIGLFALSPVPSGQLFTAAGLMDIRLVPLTAAFFAGRVVSYSIYVAAAGLASETAESLLGRALGSPLGIAIQIARVDWIGRARSHRATGRGRLA